MNWGQRGFARPDPHQERRFKLGLLPKIPIQHIRREFLPNGILGLHAGQLEQNGPER